MISTPQHNQQVATIFRSIAERLAAQRANPYRVRAYRKAADTIEVLEEDLADVASRQALEDIEAIKKLKARYWNSVDGKRWEQLSECLTEDFEFENPHLGKMEGRSFVVGVLKKVMKTATTAHQARAMLSRS